MRPSKNLASLFVAATYLLFSGAASGLLAQSSESAPPPKCSLAANAGNDIQAFQGSPLILEANLYHPNHASISTLIVPVLINAKNGSWANTIQLAVTDVNGTTQIWPIKLIGSPAGSITLDDTTEGDLTWVVAPSATAMIAPGVYSVVAAIDTTSSAGATGWNGITTSDSVTIQISPLPSPLAVDQQEEQAELLAMYHHLTGNDAQAISDIQSYLTQQPNDVAALELEGNLFEAMGQPDNALDTYDEAVGAFFVSAIGAVLEPPTELSIPQGTLRSNLFSQAGLGGTPQVSVQLAGQGKQSPGVSFLDLQITNLGTDVAENVNLNQLVLQAQSGTGQAIFNNVLSPRLPIHASSLEVNGSTTVRIFVTTQGTVGTISLSETGTVVDIFGTQIPFSQTQSISLNSSGGGGGGGGNPVPLTITGPTINQIYGLSIPSTNNVTYSGFVNGDTFASLTGILNCTTTAQSSSPVGTYPITCSGLTSQKYTITFVPGALSITPAPLAVTANNASRSFGQSNPPFTGSILGFVNGDTSSSLSGTLACTSTATSSSSVSGSPYAIACSGVSSSNYTITFVPGSLTITKATPLITWSNPASITQGIALGSLQLNATANAPGTFSYTPPSGTVLLAGPAQLLSVNFTPNDAADYNGASASVIISVAPAALLPLTITVNNTTQQYGQTTPALNNVTYTGFAKGDGPASLTGALLCTISANSSSPVGTYPITCSGLSSNKYQITFVSGTLSITRAPLTITAISTSRAFGQQNPLLTASFSAFANGDNLASLSGTLACSTSATSASSVTGSPYPINCSAVSSPNYAITFIPGSLAITRATPTITWSNPLDLGLGLPLGAAQLNASANASGAFVYTPPAGTFLPAGNAQTLSATFTPTDTADYNSANASVLINVKAVPGDLNGDGVVNCADLAIIKASFGKKTGQAGFDLRADINGDGIVNVIDLAFVSRKLPAGTVCK